jgi:hypothetical protein
MRVFMFEPRPEILSAPNIPKPLHGLNPRSLMGREAWDNRRKEVYESTQFHCAACGVHKSDAKKHKWLEAHEIFEIDYEAATATLIEIVPLCHFCHAFIHSGLTRVRARNKQITPAEVRAIMQHGCDVLRLCDGHIFLGTSALCQLVGVDCSDLPCIEPPHSDASWGAWRMVWNGKEYRGKYKTFNDWRRAYS